MKLTTSSTVATALTTGVSPNRIREYTLIGNVADVGLVVKNAMMNSSNDNVNATSAPDRMPGRISGNVTRKNVAVLLAPRSCEASSTERSKYPRRVRTIAATKIMSNTTCAAMIVCSPRETLANVKNDSSPIASTMSGTTAGRKSALSSTRLLTVRSSPIASRVPSTVEIAVTASATTIVFLNESISSGLRSSSEYHCVENPPQRDGRPVSLNESAISTTIGTYRKA